MGSSSVEVLSLVLGILSFVSFIVCSTTDCWRQDAKDVYASIGLSFRCRGLWSECLYDNMVNIWTCDIPISYLSEHPMALVVTRTLVIINGVLGIAAVPVLILGMKCTTIVGNVDNHKLRFSRAAGIMLLLGGVSGGAAVFWYAVDTAIRYQEEVVLGVPGITYELGYSYWFAAVTAICACVPASLLICSNCRRKVAREAKPSRASQCRSRNNAMTYL